MRDCSVGDNATPAFSRIVSMLDYPMFVVTTRVGAERSGCLVGFASQVSIHPARFLVGLSKLNHTYRVTTGGATHLGVHVLTPRQARLARLFGGETGDEIDKFSCCAWRDGPRGVPILCDTAAWFVGRIHRRLDLGDHLGYLLDPTAGEAPEVGITLLSYSDVKNIEAGHPA